MQKRSNWGNKDLRIQTLDKRRAVEIVCQQGEMPMEYKE
jgi:hypothetical protein